MKILLVLLLAFCCSALRLPAQESFPTLRILPEDVVQSTIRQVRSPAGTNKFAVIWTYTEAGAKKALAFRRAHDGQETITRVGSFESRGRVYPLKSYPAGWVNDEGWLKTRTDKFFSVSEEDARKIIAGLKTK